MKKSFLVIVSLLVFFTFNSNVYAKPLGVGLFCNKGVTSEDDKIVSYKGNYYNFKYTKGDEIICYLSVLYDGDVEIKKASFDIISNDNFEFKKFEKSSLWENFTIDENNITLSNEEGITGNFVIGKLYYTMLNDGDDLVLEISPLYLNNTDVIEANVSSIINNSKEETEPIPEKEPTIEQDENTEDEEQDKDLLIYILIGVVILLLLLNIIQFFIIRKMNKVY